jgi:hypothetical protein
MTVAIDIWAAKSRIGGLNVTEMKSSPSVSSDLWIDEFAAQRFEAFERAFLIRSRQPRRRRHIGGEDRSEAAAYVSSPAARRKPDK